MASIYTQDDLIAIKQAIIDLVTGVKVVKINFDNGTGRRDFTYQSVDLPQLRALKQEVESELSATRRGVVVPRSIK